MAKKSAFFSSLIEKGQFRVDDKGHATLFGEFLFLMPPLVIVKLQEELEERLGETEMRDLMSDLGRYHIEQAVERQSSKYDLDTISRDKLLTHTMDILNILGWGKADIASLDEQNHTFKLTVQHPTLPSVYRNRLEKVADKPICHYLRGIIAKDFEVLLGEKLQVRESQCAAMDGNRCVFEGAPKD